MYSKIKKMSAVKRKGTCFYYMAADQRQILHVTAANPCYSMVYRCTSCFVLLYCSTNHLTQQLLPRALSLSQRVVIDPNLSEVFINFRHKLTITHQTWSSCDRFGSIATL